MGNSRRSHRHQPPTTLQQVLYRCQGNTVFLDVINIFNSLFWNHFSKEPLPTLNIFSSRVRRYSASFSPLAKSNASRLSQACIQTPRVSQLRQEECADISNIREVNHEREVHTAMQLSQSWEDLTLCTENWSCKSGDSVDLSNPLHVNLPAGQISCSSPSPNR